jgi:uncharacterized protein (TIGR02246 family)
MAASDPRDNHGIFEKLASAGDVEGLLQLYEEDAAYVAGPGKDMLLRGHEQIGAALRAMIEAGYETKLELIHLVEVGDVAFEKSRWTTRLPAEDGTISEITGISTVVLRRQADGSWRMVVDDPGIAD